MTNRMREHYFHEVARRLFTLRGAPFFLSGREMEVLEEWEAKGIPLAVVREGIGVGYEAFRRRKGKRRRFLLTFCHPYVRAAFAQYRDRRVGRKSTPKESIDKIPEIRRQVEAFLAALPAPVSDLKEIYLRVLEELNREALDDLCLEDLDAEIESTLYKKATTEDRRRLVDLIAQEYTVSDAWETERLARVKWVKSMRHKYKIPHVSPFYY